MFHNKQTDTYTGIILLQDAGNNTHETNSDFLLQHGQSPFILYETLVCLTLNNPCFSEPTS